MAELVLFPLPECDSCQKPESADELYTCIPGILLCYDCHKKFIYDTSSKIIINRFDNLKYNKHTKTFEPFDFKEIYGFNSLNFLTEKEYTAYKSIVDDKTIS